MKKKMAKRVAMIITITVVSAGLPPRRPDDLRDLGADLLDELQGVGAGHRSLSVGRLHLGHAAGLCKGQPGPARP